jgi:TctA family transporter
MLLPLATLVVNFIKRVIYIDKNLLYPVIILFSMVGSFAINNSLSSIIVMLGMGVLGYFLQRSQYPISPIILGMILGPMLEKNLLSSLIKSNGHLLAFVERPVSAGLGICFLIVILMQIINIIQASRATSQIRE